MPKLYIYLDNQASQARNESFLYIMQQLEAVWQPTLDTAPKQDDVVECDFVQAYQACLDNKIQADSYQVRGHIQGWDLVFLSQDAYIKLIADMKNASRYLNKYGALALQQSEYASFSGDDILISFVKEGAGLSLLKEGKMLPLRLDFEQVAYRQRLLRGGRQKEAVSRAVLQGISEDAVVFDATAGLGRESMILAHAKARILAFERQLPVWIILADALQRAQNSRFFPFTLPVLHPLGTILDYGKNLSLLSDNEQNHNKESLSLEDLATQSLEDLATQSLEDLAGQSLENLATQAGKHSLVNAFKLCQTWGKPEVIYYDPMFPERESAAQVKKDMFIFQQVIGHDTDSVEFLQYALTLAQKRVVVKRPSFAPAIETENIKCAYAVDGGQCRFDCYVVNS